MKNSDLGQKSIIIGLGKTGLSVAKYFSAKGLPFEFMDTRSSPPMIEEFKTHFPDIKIEIGKLKESSLLGAKELIISPGLSIKTPAGIILHIGDWKIDPNPLIGDKINEKNL